MKVSLAVILSLLLFGCASTQIRIEASQLAELEKGRTTVTDVMGRFGRPTVLSKNMDGSQTAAYMQAAGRSNASGYVPLMAAIVSNSEPSVASVTFYFDSKGVLTQYKTTQPREVAEVAPASATSQSTAAAPPSSAAGNAASPAQTAAKPKATQARSSSGDPWKIELHPSGYRENR
jgi:hypothetical protein